MESALDPAAWSEFFVATAGVGAALAGLVFVALSINLRDIVHAPSLVARGAESLLLLLAIALVAIVGLWPASSVVVGVVIAIVGIVVWLTVTAMVARTGVGEATRSQRAVRIGFAQVATLATIIAGVSVALGVGPGLDLIVLADLAALAGGVSGAWVLVVEILR